MTFLNPILAAVALSCIAIPIVIHILMRKRRRPVEWGAMRFLIEAYQKQRKRLNLEQLLLLASRCLLVGLLALAVGKPILQAAGAIGPRGPRTLYLLIDNSLTASAVDASGTSALERHKATALKLAAELEQSRGDRVGVLTLASPADAVILPATVDLSGVAGVIKDVGPTDARADFAGALEKLRDLRESGEVRKDEGGAYLAILSDFRVGSMDPDQSLSAFAGAASGARIVALRPSSTQLSNVAIGEVTPLESVLLGGGSGGGERTALPVRVGLRRSGENGAAMTKVRLEAMPQNRGAAGVDRGTDAASVPRAAERVVSWKPGEDSTFATLTLDLGAGDLGGAGTPIVLRASIDRDSIANDNTLLRTVESRDRLAVALLAPPMQETTDLAQYAAAQWLALALAPADDGSLRTRRAGDIAVTRLDPVRDLGDATGGVLGPLTGFDAILVPEPELLDAAGWQRLRAAAGMGAAVIVFPPAKDATPAWLESFQSSFGIDLDASSEAQVFEAAQRLVAPPAEGSGLFAMLAGEFDDLAKSVGVTRAIRVQPRGGSMVAALTLSDGTPLVLTGLPSGRGPDGAGDASRQAAFSAGRGVVLLVTTAMDLSWTDLPAKPMMVPFVQEMVRQGVGQATSGRTGIAGQTISLPAGTVELSPLAFSGSEADRAAAGAPIAVDSVRGAASPMRRAGVWKARASSGAALGIVAVKADVSASRVELRGDAEVASWLATLGVGVEWLDEGKLTTQAAEEDGAGREGGSVLSSGPQKPPISFPLLVAAMMIAIAEVVMARVFSHARIDSGVVADGGDEARGASVGGDGGAAA